MKICISNDKKSWEESTTGKGKFILRLAPELEKLGAELYYDNKTKTDIDLQIGRIRYKPNAKRSVLRLGPAHVDTSQNYRKLNADKRRSLKKTGAVIYQSLFSKKVCHKFIGKCKNEAVIYNGADPEYYNGFEPYNSCHRINFIASTRKWIPQKRLKTIIEAFIEAKIPDSYLIVTGNILKKCPDRDDILYTGYVSDSVLAKFYRLCNAMIHPVYLDACPNSVVEALVAGCPVIHTSEGGTKEIVKNEEWQIKDKQYNFDPINLQKPPKLDKAALIEKMFMAASSDYKPDGSHIHIRNIAEQYMNFFKEML